LFLRIKYTPPKLLLIIALIIGAFVLNLASLFRSTTGELQLDAFDVGNILQFNWVTSYIKLMTEVDWLNEYSHFLIKENSFTELKYAASAIEVTQRHMEFRLGGYYWDRLILGWIPAYFLGSDVKNAFYISPINAAELTELIHYYFQGQTEKIGMALPVVGQLFFDFWLFGALIYIPFARFYKFLWIAAKYLENPLLRVFYSLTLPAIGSGVSSGLEENLYQLTVQFALLLPVAFFSKIPSSSSTKITIHDE
jgi:hypothetical protein